MAFLRAEPTFDLCYEVVDHEPLIVLMPSDHRLTSREAIHPREFVGEIFIGGSNKATVLRAVTEDYLRRSGLDEDGEPRFSGAWLSASLLPSEIVRIKPMQVIKLDGVVVAHWMQDHAVRPRACRCAVLDAGDGLDI